MRLNLCNSLESRDGTLAADAKLKNAVVENIEGAMVVVKRPGITLRTDLAPGLAQGLFSLNGVAYGIVNDTLWGPFTPGSGGSTEQSWVQVGGVVPTGSQSPSINGQTYSFVFGGKIWLIDFSEGYFAYNSADGITWNAVGPGPSMYVFDGNHFVTVFGSQIYVLNKLGTVHTSTDGVSWTTTAQTGVSTDGSGNSELVQMGGALYMLQQTILFKSDDGVFYQNITNVPELPSCNLVALGSTLFALPTSGRKAVYSGTGNGNWTLLTSDWGLGAVSSLYGFGTFNGKLYVCGAVGAGTNSNVYSSADGITWTLETFSTVWSARKAPVVADFGGKLTVIGGFGKFDFWQLIGASASVPSNAL